MPRWLLLTLFAISAGMVSRPALAQDTDDEFIFDDEVDEPEDSEEPDSPPPPIEEGEAEEPEEEDDEVDFDDPVDEEEEGEPLDFLDDDGGGEAAVLAPGTDTAEIYRAEQAEVEDLPIDEEVMAWEAYLKEYPNSLFTQRIEAHMDSLLESQYRVKIEDVGVGVDADQAEILLVQPAHMTNLNPRTRLNVGLEFGFPNHIRASADFEYAILRQLSVHGGVAGRYQGWGVEAGARYAFVKSTRLQLVATLIADVRFNFNPLYFVVRPQIGIGKILGPAQILLSFGSEIETRTNATVGLIGGAHVSIRVAPPVAVFVETDFHVRNLTREGGVFAFDVVSVGLRFFPRFKNGREDDPVEIAAAGHVPAASQYLQYYFGSVQAQGTYYLPTRSAGRR